MLLEGCFCTCFCAFGGIFWGFVFRSKPSKAGNSRSALSGKPSVCHLVPGRSDDRKNVQFSIIILLRDVLLPHVENRKKRTRKEKKSPTAQKEKRAASTSGIGIPVLLPLFHSGRAVFGATRGQRAELREAVSPPRVQRALRVRLPLPREPRAELRALLVCAQLR